MESSSDDSFAWTDASADDKDSDAMASEHIKSNQNGEESESGHSYKGKLHKQLFENQERQNSHLDEIPHKKKKRKIKELTYDEDVESTNEKHIKTEFASDTDIKKKKKKKSHQNNIESGVLNASQNSTELDISHLNEDIKQEQASFETITNARNSNNQYDFESPTKKKKSKKNKHNDDIQQSLQSVQCDNEEDIKNNHDIEDTDSKGMVIEDMFSAEETVVELSQKKKKKLKSENHTKKRKSSEEGELNNSNTCKKRKNQQNASHSSKEDLQFVRKDDSYDEGIETQSDDHIKYNNTSLTLAHNSFINGHSQDNDSDSGVQHEINSTNVSTSQQHNTTSKKISRISDRITFEDDIDSDMKTQQQSDDENYIQSSHFKQFLERNINLKPITKLNKRTLLTQDNEIWVLKLPSEVDVESLKGVQFILGDEGKIKCNGQTYEGVMDDNTEKIDLISCENHKLQINSIRLSGMVHYIKKMRKEHSFDDNIMVNNQTNFVHLQETKTHHPLFGFDYRKDIKVPSFIGEHLEAGDHEAESSLLNNEKKKKKKQKQKKQNFSVDLELELESTVKSEPEVLEKKKKKRKRKHSEEGEPSLNKAKRVKKDPDCVETWDSEKAIEENLFNF